MLVLQEQQVRQDAELSRERAEQAAEEARVLADHIRSRSHAGGGTLESAVSAPMAQRSPLAAGHASSGSSPMRPRHALIDASDAFGADEEAEVGCRATAARATESGGDMTTSGSLLGAIGVEIAD